MRIQCTLCEGINAGGILSIDISCILSKIKEYVNQDCDYIKYEYLYKWVFVCDAENIFDSKNLLDK